DQSLNVSVLIDHECQAALVALKIQELRIESCTGRNKIGFSRLCSIGQNSLIEMSAGQFMHDLLHVQQPDDVIDLALIKRQPRVLTLAQLFDDAIPVIVDVD